MSERLEYYAVMDRDGMLSIVKRVEVVYWEVEE